MAARFLNLWMNPFIVLLKSLPIFRYVLKTWWAEGSLARSSRGQHKLNMHIEQSTWEEAPLEAVLPARAAPSSTVYRRGNTPTRLWLSPPGASRPPSQSRRRAEQGKASPRDLRHAGLWICGPATPLSLPCTCRRAKLAKSRGDGKLQSVWEPTRRLKASVFFSRVRGFWEKIRESIGGMILLFAFNFCFLRS